MQAYVLVIFLGTQKNWVRIILFPASPNFLFLACIFCCADNMQAAYMEPEIYISEVQSCVLGCSTVQWSELSAVAEKKLTLRFCNQLVTGRNAGLCCVGCGQQGCGQQGRLSLWVLGAASGRPGPLKCRPTGTATSYLVESVMMADS